MTFTLTLYTIAEAAEYLNLKKETLRARMKKTKISVHRVGTQDVITKDSLETLEKMGEPEKGRPSKHKK